MSSATRKPVGMIPSVKHGHSWSRGLFWMLIHCLLSTDFALYKTSLQRVIASSSMKYHMRLEIHWKYHLIFNFRHFFTYFVFILRRKYIWCIPSTRLLLLPERVHCYYALTSSFKRYIAIIGNGWLARVVVCGQKLYGGSLLPLHSSKSWLLFSIKEARSLLHVVFTIVFPAYVSLAVIFPRLNSDFFPIFSWVDVHWSALIAT